MKKPTLASLVVQAMQGTIKRTRTPEEIAHVVLILTEVEGKLDDVIERLYLSEYAIDAGQLMAALTSVGSVRKDLEAELPKPKDDADENPDHCPSCGIPLVLKTPDDPTGPAECPVCDFQAPAYPQRSGMGDSPTEGSGHGRQGAGDRARPDAPSTGG